MPKVTFERDYDWQIPGKRGMIAFKAGWSGLVNTPQAEAARAAGVLRAPLIARPVKNPKSAEQVAREVEAKYPKIMEGLGND